MTLIQTSGKCICGDFFDCVDKREMAKAIEADFWKLHSGKGHGKSEPIKITKRAAALDREEQRNG